MITSLTEMSSLGGMQRDKEKPTQPVKVVERMEDFLEEGTLEMHLNKRIFK